jgi:hypothetical protein
MSKLDVFHYEECFPLGFKIVQGLGNAWPTPATHGIVIDVRLRQDPDQRVLGLLNLMKHFDFFDSRDTQAR